MKSLLSHTLPKCHQSKEGKFEGHLITEDFGNKMLPKENKRKVFEPANQFVFNSNYECKAYLFVLDNAPTADRI